MEREIKVLLSVLNNTDSKLIFKNKLQETTLKNDYDEVKNGFVNKSVLETDQNNGDEN